MNQILDLLLRCAAGDDAECAIRETAYRAGLLWLCVPCGCDVTGGKACQMCGMPPPDGTPEPPVLAVIPVVSRATNAPVVVCDTDEDAVNLVEWFVDGHGTDLILVGAGIPYNPVIDERLLDYLDHFTERATENPMSRESPVPPASL